MVVLRRLEGKPAERKAVAEMVSIGACKLNLRSRQLSDAKGREVPLTAMEFTLLKTFLDHPNQVLSRDRLLTHHCASCMSVRSTIGAIRSRSCARLRRS